MPLVPQLLTARPAPGSVPGSWRRGCTCPPERAAVLEQQAWAALGTPAADLVQQVLSDGADRVDAMVELLASWLRRWDWSLVLSAWLLASFDPLMSALRCLRPAGPADPHAAADLMSTMTEPALTADGLGSWPPRRARPRPRKPAQTTMPLSRTGSSTTTRPPGPPTYPRL